MWLSQHHVCRCAYNLAVPHMSLFESDREGNKEGGEVEMHKF